MDIGTMTMPWKNCSVNMGSCLKFLHFVDSLESGSKFMSNPFKLLLKSTVASMKHHD